MNTAKFTTFTYDLVDEISLGQIEKIASLQLDYDPDSLHVPTSIEMQELEDKQVALQLYHPQTGKIKKFACYDPGLTQLNSQLLISKASALPDEIVKTAAFFLKRAALNQGVVVPEELASLAGDFKPTNNIVELEKISEIAYYKKLNDKTEKETTKWALQESKRYPLDSKEDIEKAAEYFEKYANSFTAPDKLMFAINTCREASNKNIKLAGSITKFASLSTDSFNENFDKLVNMRKTYLNPDQDPDIYDELIERHPNLGVVKTAKVLEVIDREYGLDRLWSRQLADPISTTCGIYKEAELEIDGKYITKSKLASLLQKDVSNWIDDYTKKELSGPEGLDVLASLPEPTREGLLSEL